MTDPWGRSHQRIPAGLLKHRVSSPQKSFISLSARILPSAFSMGSVSAVAPAVQQVASRAKWGTTRLSR